MNAIKIVTLFGAIGALSAEPFPYKNGEGVDPEIRLMIKGALSKKVGPTLSCVGDIDRLDNPDVAASFPSGKFYQTSAVIWHEASKHAAIWDAVVFLSGETQVVLSMSGDRSQFEGLLKSVSFSLDDSAKAEKLAKAYTAIYMLNPVGEPKVERDENTFSIQFDFAPDEDGKKRSISVSLACDKERKVTRVTEKRVEVESK